MCGPDLPTVVIGAGAAGLLAAVFAAGGSRRVLLLERTPDGGRKILVSGGGRCNVLPARLEPARFVTASSPNTLRKILLSWPLPEQRRFFEDEAGIPLALEEETGKLFPASNRARDVRDALLRLAAGRGVETLFGALVEDLSISENAWAVRLQDGREIRACAVILATGGLSLPGTGSDGTGLSIVRRLGHTVHDTYPALTPLTLDPPRHAPLAGISLEVNLEAGRFATRGGFLFTHRGYSGPAILDASHLAVRSRLAGGPLQPIHVAWTNLDAQEWDRRLREGTGTAATPLRRALPDRLAGLLLQEAGVEPQRPLAQLRRAERRRLVELLTRYPLPWTGDEGYRKAEVTGGGVALSEVDPRTLESRLHPGLFLCGEILDAFGPIGGHNFAWAWGTGRAAGLGALYSSHSGRKGPTMTDTDLRYPIGKFLRVAERTDAQRQESIAVVAATPANLRAAVQGLTEEQLDTPYRPGGWTVRQVVHHVPDSHLNAYLRFKLALTEDNPTIKTYKEALWAELEDSRSTPVEVSLTLLDSVHDRWVRILRAMKPEDFARPFIHPENGPMILDGLLALYDWHGRHHVAHVTGLRERMGWS